MPRAPLKPCRHPGCAALATSGYCPAHPRRVMRDRRPSAAARGYNGEWQTIRAIVLAEEPCCRKCGEPSSMVDHITPLRQGGTHARENLQALCRSCHGKKTARDGSRKF